MSKKENRFWSAIKITANALKLYCINIDKFFIYMAFPVLGSFLGIILVFIPTYFYAKNLPHLTQNYAFFNNTISILLVMLIISAPGLLIFFKAFWDYLVAMGALNSMALNLGKSGRISDTKIHNEIIKNRSKQYVLLLLLLAIITFIPVLPLFLIGNLILKLLLMGVLTVLTGIVWVYVSLAIQAFMMDESTSATRAIEKSYLHVKYNFVSTLFILLLIMIITYILLPELFAWIAQKTTIDYKLSAPVETFMTLLPIDEIIKSPLFTQAKLDINTLQIAVSIVIFTIESIIMGFTLPIRAIICTNWYKLLDADFKNDRVATKKNSKKDNED